MQHARLLLCALVYMWLPVFCNGRWLYCIGECREDKVKEHAKVLIKTIIARIQQEPSKILPVDSSVEGLNFIPEEQSEVSVQAMHQNTILFHLIFSTLSGETVNQIQNDLENLRDLLEKLRFILACYFENSISPDIKNRLEEEYAKSPFTVEMVAFSRLLKVLQGMEENVDKLTPC